MNRNRKILAICLSVHLSIASVPPQEVHASCFSDLCGGLFTFITAPIWVFCQDNPTFRKNNPFRKKKWEEEIDFQPEPQEKKNEQYSPVNIPSPRHIPVMPTPEPTITTTPTLDEEKIYKKIIDYINNNADKFRGKDGKTPTLDDWNIDLIRADTQLQQRWENSYAQQLFQTVNDAITEGDALLDDVEIFLDDIRNETAEWKSKINALTALPNEDLPDERKVKANPIYASLSLYFLLLMEPAILSCANGREKFYYCRLFVNTFFFLQSILINCVNKLADDTKSNVSSTPDQEHNEL